MPDDTPLLKALAHTQTTHIKLICELTDELDFLRSKYGLESYAYGKTLNRLQRAERLYKEYEQLFDGYLYHTTQLQTHLTVFKKMYENAKIKHPKGDSTATATDGQTNGRENRPKVKARTNPTTGKRERGSRSPQPLKIGHYEG